MKKRPTGRASGETGSAEYQSVEALVPIFRLRKLREQLARLATIAKRAGQPFSYEIGEPNQVVTMVKAPKFLGDEGEEFDVAAASVKVRGILVPRTHGWRMIAALEGVDVPGGKMVNLVHKIDERYPVDPKYKTLVGQCDHCKKSRQRVMTFVLRNDGGVEKVVGRNCLADFLNDTSAEMLIEHAATLSELLEAEKKVASDDEMAEYGRSRASEFRRNKVLFFTAYIARKTGFVSKRRAEELGTLSTAQVVSDLLTGAASPSKELREAYEDKSSEEHRKTQELVDKTLAFFKALPEGQSEYTDNLKVLLENPFVLTKHFGLVASSVGYYQIEAKKLAEASASSSRFLGEVGKDLYLPAVTLTFVKAFDGTYGTSYMHLLETPEGHKLVWFSSSQNLEDRKGQTFSILGKVKAHRKNERTGVEETMLTRAVVDAKPPAPPKEPKRSAEARAATAEKKAQKAQDKYLGALRKGIEMVARGGYASGYGGSVSPVLEGATNFHDARVGDYSVRAQKNFGPSGLQYLVMLGLGEPVKMNKTEQAAFEAYMTAQLSDYVSVKQPYYVAFKALAAWASGRPATAVERLTEDERRHIAAGLEYARILSASIENADRTRTFPPAIVSEDTLVESWWLRGMWMAGAPMVRGVRPGPVGMFAESEMQRDAQRDLDDLYIKHLGAKLHGYSGDYRPMPVRWGDILAWMNRTLATGSSHGRSRRGRR